MSHQDARSTKDTRLCLESLGMLCPSRSAYFAYISEVETHSSETYTEREREDERAANSSKLEFSAGYSNALRLRVLELAFISLQTPNYESCGTPNTTRNTCLFHHVSSPFYPSLLLLFLCCRHASFARGKAIED